MHRRVLIPIFLLALIGHLAHAELTNFGVDKRAVYYQDSLAIETPLNGAYLDYYFDITGNTQVFNSSFSANLAEVPIQFKDEDRQRGYVAFPTVTNLQLTYPNIVFYDFTTQVVGGSPGISRGEFTSAANFSLNTPQVSNISNLSAINPASQFSINLSFLANGSTGSLGPNFIRLTIFDPVTMQSVYQQDYVWNDLSLEVPGGTLSLNKDYLARIQFVAPDTLNPEGPGNAHDVLTRYLRENWLRLRTAGNTSTVTPTVRRQYFWSQSSQNNLIADSESLRAAIPEPPSGEVSAATLSQVGVMRSYDLEEDESSADAFAITLVDDELEGFISGLIGMGWSLNSGKTNFAMENTELEEATIGPEILNFDECQDIQANSEFTISIQRPDNVSSSLLASILVLQDGEFAYSGSFSVGTLDPIPLPIPGGVLDPDESYDVTVQLSPQNSPTTGLDIGVTHEVAFPIVTRTGSWPGVESIGIYRGYWFDNMTGEEAPANLASFSVILTEDSAGEIASATFQKASSPGLTTEFPLERESTMPDQLRFAYLAPTEGDIDNDFPNGEYLARTTIDADPNQVTLPVQAASTTAPTIEIEVSYFGEYVDPSLPIPIRWTGFDASLAGHAVEVRITAESPTSPATPNVCVPLVDIAADGLSGYLPANALLENKQYSLDFIFRRDLQVNDELFTDAEFILGDEYFTNLTLFTGEANYFDWLEGFLNDSQLNNPMFADANANPDGDVFNNLQEFALNLNPLQASAPPRIQDVGTFFLVEFNWRNDTPLFDYELRFTRTLEPPFDVYQDVPNIQIGSQYDRVRMTFPYISPLFVQLVLRYGAQ